MVTQENYGYGCIVLTNEQREPIEYQGFYIPQAVMTIADEVIQTITDALEQLTGHKPTFEEVSGTIQASLTSTLMHSVLGLPDGQKAGSFAGALSKLLESPYFIVFARTTPDGFHTSVESVDVGSVEEFRTVLANRFGHL